MLTFYQVCFRAGVLFTVVTFLLGQLFDFMDFDVEFDTDADLDLDFQGQGVSPLKPVIITAFFTVFGGVGEMALKRGMSQVFTFTLALILGFVVAALFLKLIIVPLQRAQNTSAKSQKDLIGHLAKVDIGIEGDHFGRIAYTIAGNSYTAPAKSLDGMSIEKGTGVIIAKIDNNIFYVKQSEN
ncbi:NfeD family protein [Alkaliphilus crotonatoxidans]